LPSLLSAALLWPAQSALAQFNQQGPKLVGTSAVGNAEQGYSVAVSGGGNTAIVGGAFDNNGVGAAWVFTRSGGVWSQQGGKLVGTGAVGNAEQGFSVALSGDGSTAIVGGRFDNSDAGAAWVFVSGAATHRTATHDFNGDFRSDILWRNGTSGQAMIWLMNGATITSSLGLGNMSGSWTIIGTGDFNGDGKSDVLWRNNSGNVEIWFMNGTSVQSAVAVGKVRTSWAIAETGDFDGDGKSDILWRDSAGNVAIWFMNGAAIQSTASVGNVARSWTIQGANAD
jgi:hypothetical protein